MEDCLLTFDIKEVRDSYIANSKPDRYTLFNPITNKNEDFCTVFYEKDPLEKTYNGEPIQRFRSYTLRVVFDDFEKTIFVRSNKFVEGKGKWWFVCNWCKKDVGKMYMPTFGESFKCRKCHNLTYEKTQKHDKRFDNKNLIETMERLKNKLKGSRTEEQYMLGCLYWFNAADHLMFSILDKKKMKK